MSDLDEPRNLKAALREVAVAMEGELSAHPALEQLMDFVSGDLSETEREQLEDHLALCRECARTALDLAAFPEMGTGEERLPERELAAEWERFRAAVLPARPARHRLLRPPAAQLLAAVLVLAVVGLSVWSVQLRNEVRTLSAPRADVAVVDLVPLSAVERAAGAEKPARVPSWASHLVVILNLPESSDEYPEYQIEMTGPDGRVVWSRRGIRRSADGTFTLGLPRGFVPRGTSRIQVSGLRAGDVVSLATYEMRIGPE